MPLLLLLQLWPLRDGVCLKREKNSQDRVKDNPNITSFKNTTIMDKSLYETCLQEVMVVVFIILDWLFVLINTTNMIPGFV